jgi:VWFA-related protein
MTRAVRWAIGATVILATAAPAGRQTPTFSSRVEAVRVDVLVTERGQAVLGLKPADFEVIDNGVAQEVDLAAFDSIPLNVVLALDVSGSMVGEPLAELKAASRAVVHGLAPDDRAGLVTFSHLVDVRRPLTRDRASLQDALDASWSGGETALVDASQAAVILGESDVGRALVILFSDGVDTTSWLAPASVIRAARRTDAVVYAVSSPGAGATPKFLDDLCETTGGRLLEVQSTDRLTPVLLQILEEFRQRYVISYTPRGVSRDGWHALRVRVKNRGVSVKARPGYLAGPAS